MEASATSPSLRDSIVLEARALFEQEGYAKLSARKVAQRVGCSVGSIYVYFDSMDALTHAVVDSSLNKLLGRLLAIRLQDSYQALVAACDTYVQFGLEHAEDYRVAFIYQLKTGPIYPHESFRVLQERITCYQKSGKVTAFDAETAAQVVWTHLHGLVSLLIQKPGFPWRPRAQLIEDAIRLTIETLR